MFSEDTLPVRTGRLGGAEEAADSDPLATELPANPAGPLWGGTALESSSDLRRGDRPSHTHITQDEARRWARQFPAADVPVEGHSSEPLAAHIPSSRGPEGCGTALKRASGWALQSAWQSS